MEIEPETNSNVYYSNVNTKIPYINNNFIFNIYNKNSLHKRNYIESTKSINYIHIKEKEKKYLLSLLNQIKLKLDGKNNFINKKYSKENINKKHYIIDYSTIDLNDIIFELYQSNKISDELKQFLLKKLINNAIEVEKTFNNYFNNNHFPNKNNALVSYQDIKKYKEIFFWKTFINSIRNLNIENNNNDAMIIDIMDF